MKQAGEPARPLIREALQILHRLELSGVGATEVILKYHLPVKIVIFIGVEQSIIQWIFFKIFI